MAANYFNRLFKLFSLSELENPTPDNSTMWFELLDDNPNLQREAYSANKNPAWLSHFVEAGLFTQIPNAEKEGDNTIYRRYLPLIYLKNIASQEPEAVVEIINTIKTDNILDHKTCLEAINEMPADIAITAMPFIDSLFSSLNKIDNLFHGDEINKLIGKLSSDYPEVAFKLAGYLIQFKSESHNWYEDNTKLEKYWIKEYMQKHYSKLWPVDPVRGFVQLVDLMYGHIIDSKQTVEDGDKTTYSNAYIPDITNSEYYKDNPINIIISTLHTIGESLIADIEKGLFAIGYLLSKEKVLFKRIVLTLLAKSPNHDLFNCLLDSLIIELLDKNRLRRFKRELYECVNQKHTVLRQETLDKIKNQINIIAYDDKDRERYINNIKEYERRDVADEELLIDEGRCRARYFYPFKEVFKEEYEKYKTMGQGSDDDFKPRPPFSSGIRAVSGDEFSPIKKDDLIDKSFSEIINIISQSEKWPEPRMVIGDSSTIEFVRRVFNSVVSQRADEFVNLSQSDIESIPSDFISSYYDALVFCNTLDWKKVEDPEKFINLGFICLDKDEIKLEDVLLSLFRIYDKIIEGKEPVLILDQEKAVSMLELAHKCLSLDYKQVEFDDALATGLNDARGRAASLTIKLALRLKNQNPNDYEKSKFRSKLIEILDFILNQLGDHDEITQNFGQYFINICWLEEDWGRENANRIFNDLANAAWKVHLKYGRCSRITFEINKQRYQETYRIMKLHDNGFSHDGIENHIMQAYWQGWIDVDDPIIADINHLPAQMLNNCADYLGTGFQFINKGEAPEGALERVKKYWEFRIGELEKEADHDRLVVELKAFMEWPENNPFDVDYLFDMLNKTIVLWHEDMKDMWGARAFKDYLIDHFEEHPEKSIELLLKFAKIKQGCDNLRMKTIELQEMLNAIADHPDKYGPVVVEKALELCDRMGEMETQAYMDIYKRLLLIVGSEE